MTLKKLKVFTYIYCYGDSLCYPSDVCTHSERPRYIDQDVVQLVKDKLKSIPCQNQGFILDGYPESLQQANDLFASEMHPLPDSDGHSVLLPRSPLAI